MTKMFADWYCPDCDDPTMMDGDLHIDGGTCEACGAKMVTVPDEDEEGVGDGQ